MRPPLTPKRVFDAARQGDADALAVVDVVAERSPSRSRPSFRWWIRSS